MKRKGDGQSVVPEELNIDRANEPSASASYRPHPARIAKREPAYLLVAKPFEIASNQAANIRLLEYRGKRREDPYFRIISFADGTPTETIRDYMKSQGVQWNTPVGTESWNVIIKSPTRNQDRLHAEHVFRTIAQMITEEKGVVREPETERC